MGTNGTVQTDIEFVDITTMAYDDTREWIWLNDYMQYQVFVYNANTGDYVGKFPCNANKANGGIYFDRQRDIIWQVVAAKIQAFNGSSITDENSLNGFDCSANSIFVNEYKGTPQPSGAAIDSKDGSVYIGLSNYDEKTGANINQKK